ncbi:hypothetical protein CcaverHIS002_0104560 [Cutaneotrichosporon cavernicola]|uniref:Kinase-like protein n=1 Tax=Cutaneotrichosporon cavernicola TaxID=279322 RepID=A0AA48HYB2_9TREE|nr:uncharacterized protein CcaverHIS019_0104490 [Cutaneotrichosporon cavernicola]BEI79927.1 hypothetical protein CcaverHIS002_0104560 [Cutaneotrichosporon cavernicola]BEI87731.1 hypothetical protein CcaverHIS019_0104490 [Cutaneotrichosporon cavernicola]BEI95503.1 hypothetical protein CcaverHIS631_0104520 [Cutaneotrichosporon cavernicola]BEJ03277.1 hypothetical protein CcaverHIS641_0104520 [Cutaneotrichosporon cavernicola]
MSFTPSTQPLDLSAPISPLLGAQRTPHSPAMGASGLGRPILRKGSTGSFSKLADFWLDGTPSTVPGTPAEALSIVQGVPHVALSIDASKWRHPIFKQKVLGILRRLNVPRWTHPSLKGSSIHLQKVSGALTNAVFFVSFNPNPEPTSPSMSPMLTPTMPPSDPENPPDMAEGDYPQTLLLRVYGVSTDQLISRDEELRILHVLSETYGLGPRMYGTFANGRVEQFFPSRALVPAELREPLIARGIARRMRELHSADLHLLGYNEGRETEPQVWKCVNDWIEPAQEILSVLEGIGGKWEVWVAQFGLHKLREELDAYRQWVTAQPDKGKGVVFSHNDTQYGNLLLLDAEIPAGMAPHHKYIVVDFEYAAPNCRGYDIANHFHEWRANYHDPVAPHLLHGHGDYPTLEQRQDWYRAYLSVQMSVGEEKLCKRAEIAQERVDALEREVRIWSPACAAMWCLWGVISAEEQVRAYVANPDSNEELEFDYLEYSLERRRMFVDEVKSLGVPL